MSAEEEAARALADALWHAPVDPDLGFRQNCDEMGAHLAALGYRLTTVEHVHYAPLDAAPGMTIHAGGLTMITPPPPATHRRRTFLGPWEPMPEGETVEADSITFTSEGQP
ncbi:hypothetical protein QDA05_gp89 [Microbacterium phage Honeyfin]|uniref:Uncharacterized protein n=1 Tax=Microbacterium phage Honeyfin TaxID=2871520 RepID=A0AAE8C0G5_9CAUD|nr:hypothetical protein QDA05_gp89 [Microbacterium phage Honeyfin]QZD99024.1 hypothetical protein SEA_HONEYFIN_89 [Microbacterium phage Honeyfin]